MKQAEIVKISKIRMNPNNPRVVKDEKFKKLVQSIKDFPRMLEIRPIVVNKDMIVLGGNMRLKACQEIGLDEVPVLKAEDLTEEEQRQFIIKDNVGFGEWDWEMLANEWDAEELNEWGLEVWENNEVDIDSFFEESDEEGKNNMKIILEYNEEDYEKVISKLNEIEGSNEKIIFELLGL